MYKLDIIDDFGYKTITYTYLNYSKWYIIGM